MFRGSKEIEWDWGGRLEEFIPSMFHFQKLIIFSGMLCRFVFIIFCIFLKAYIHALKYYLVTKKSESLKHERMVKLLGLIAYKS